MNYSIGPIKMDLPNVPIIYLKWQFLTDSQDITISCTVCLNRSKRRGKRKNTPIGARWRAARLLCIITIRTQGGWVLRTVNKSKLIPTYYWSYGDVRCMRSLYLIWYFGTTVFPYKRNTCNHRFFLRNSTIVKSSMTKSDWIVYVCLVIQNICS